MASNAASNNKIIGIVLVVIAIGLAYWAYRMSGSVGSQLTEAVTGSPGDNVMIYYIGAAVAAAVGVFFLVKK